MPYAKKALVFRVSWGQISLDFTSIAQHRWIKQKVVTQHDGFDISVFWSFFGVTVVETQVLFVVEHEVDESQIYNESKNTF